MSTVKRSMHWDWLYANCSNYVANNETIQQTICARPKAHAKYELFIAKEDTGHNLAETRYLFYLSVCTMFATTSNYHQNCKQHQIKQKFQCATNVPLNLPTLNYQFEFDTVYSMTQRRIKKGNNSFLITPNATAASAIILRKIQCQAHMKPKYDLLRRKATASNWLREL